MLYCCVFFVVIFHGFHIFFYLSRKARNARIFFSFYFCPQITQISLIFFFFIFDSLFFSSAKKDALQMSRIFTRFASVFLSRIVFFLSRIFFYLSRKARNSRILTPARVFFSHRYFFYLTRKARNSRILTRCASVNSQQSTVDGLGFIITKNLHSACAK